MLLHAPSFIYDRDASTSTEGRKDAQGLKAEVMEEKKEEEASKVATKKKAQQAPLPGQIIRPTKTR
jgi:hypothetical protein